MASAIGWLMTFEKLTCTDIGDHARGAKLGAPNQ
jgi:hypothetical protein